MCAFSFSLKIFTPPFNNDTFVNDIQDLPSTKKKKPGKEIKSATDLTKTCLEIYVTPSLK